MAISIKFGQSAAPAKKKQDSSKTNPPLKKIKIPKPPKAREYVKVGEDGDVRTPYHNLKSMGHERMLQLDQLLRQHVSPQKCADIIQNDWGLLPEVLNATLTKTLQRYKRRALVDPLLVNVVKDEHDRAQITKHLREQFDAVAEMQNMAQLQKARIYNLLEKEKTMKMPMTMTKGEMTLYMDMLDRILKAQFDTGFLQFHGRQPLLGVVNPGGMQAGHTSPQLENAIQEANTIFARMAGVNMNQPPMKDLVLDEEAFLKPENNGAPR